MIRWGGPPWVLRVLALLMVAVPAVVLVPSSAQAVPTVQASQNAAATQAAYCGIRWGSLPKQAVGNSVAGSSQVPVRNVRAGQHACYDRLVVDVAGKVSGAFLRYVVNVHTDGAGTLVPLRGGGKLQLVVQAPAYDSQGHATYVPANRRELVNVTGYRTFRQVAWAGTFEGQTTIGLGARARLPMRVFVLDGPGSGSRVVVDVAHRW